MRPKFRYNRPMLLGDSPRFRIPIRIGRRLVLLRDAPRIHGLLARLETPDADALPLESLLIPRKGRTLEAACLVPPQPVASLLLLHGIGDQLAYWEPAQRLLASHGIASMVFHYAGFGRSTGATTPANLREDTLAAAAALRARLEAAAQPMPLFLFGFSLGTGIAVDAAPYLNPPPAGLILSQAFTSLRAAARALASPLAAPILPDIWHTHRLVSELKMPLLVIHGDADRLFPNAMAHEITSAARAGSSHPVRLAEPAGYAHGDPYLRPTLDYWQPVLDFIKEMTPRTAQETDAALLRDLV